MLPVCMLLIGTTSLCRRESCNHTRPLCYSHMIKFLYTLPETLWTPGCVAATTMAVLATWGLLRRGTRTGAPRAVLIPTDRLRKRSNLTEIETVAVSAVSERFLAVRATLATGKRWRVVAVIVLTAMTAAATVTAAASHLQQPNLYAVLGTHRNATTADIKRAYRDAAFRTHPDKAAASGEEFVRRAEARFQAVTTAAEVLTDARSRDIYERHGYKGLKCAAIGLPPQTASLCDGDRVGFLIYDAVYLSVYLAAAVVTMFAMNRANGGPTRSVCLTLYATLVMVELGSRGYFNDSPWELPHGHYDWYDDHTHYEKAVACRFLFAGALMVAVIVDALLVRDVQHDLFQSYFNALLKGQDDVRKSMESRETTINWLSPQLEYDEHAGTASGDQGGHRQ
jgi:hypothetical protein